MLRPLLAVDTLRAYLFLGSYTKRFETLKTLLVMSENLHVVEYNSVFFRLELTHIFARYHQLPWALVYHLIPFGS